MIRFLLETFFKLGAAYYRGQSNADYSQTKVDFSASKRDGFKISLYELLIVSIVFATALAVGVHQAQKAALSTAGLAVLVACLLGTTALGCAIGMEICLRNNVRAEMNRAAVLLVGALLGAGLCLLFTLPLTTLPK